MAREYRNVAPKSMRQLIGGKWLCHRTLLTTIRRLSTMTGDAVKHCVPRRLVISYRSAGCYNGNSGWNHTVGCSVPVSVGGVDALSGDWRGGIHRLEYSG